MARLTGGIGKGRHLVNAPDSRPTSGRARQALFQIIASDLTGAAFGDSFAGGGSIGIEALMRGAQSATFIEISHRGFVSIRENLIRVGFQPYDRDRWRNEEGQTVALLQSDFFKEIRRDPPLGVLDVWFLDPPWTSVEVPHLISELGDNQWQTSGALLILEHSGRVTLTDPSGYERIDQRRYGDTAFTMWHRK